MTYFNNLIFRYVLTSGFFVAPGMEEIRMIKLAENLNFPKVSKDEAKQFVALLKSKLKYGSFDEDQLADILVGRFVIHVTSDYVDKTIRSVAMFSNIHFPRVP
jgi:hypothetical protein